jgi:long-chain acyl-CoA synthetase
MMLSDQGEILVRGENVVMGYLNQLKTTGEAIDPHGWLHTGDAGEVDADGYYRLVGRISDVITTAGGRNLAPSQIENAVKVSPYIADAVVVGDGKQFLTCLVMIDHGAVEQFAQDHAVPFSNFLSLCRAPQVRDLIQQELDKVNAELSDAERIKAFRLIEHKLTAGDEEFTATLQLKRDVVRRKYAELIEDMYRPRLHASCTSTVAMPDSQEHRKQLA